MNSTSENHSENDGGGQNKSQDVPAGAEIIGKSVIHWIYSDGSGIMRGKTGSAGFHFRPSEAFPYWIHTIQKSEFGTITFINKRGVEFIFSPHQQSSGTAFLGFLTRNAEFQIKCHPLQEGVLVKMLKEFEKEFPDKSLKEIQQEGVRLGTLPYPTMIG